MGGRSGVSSQLLFEVGDGRRVLNLNSSSFSVCEPLGSERAKSDGAQHFATLNPYLIEGRFDNSRKDISNLQQL